MYDVYLKLIGKRVVDFLLALLELFSLRVTAEELQWRKYIKKSAISLQRCQFDPKFQVEGDSFPSFSPLLPLSSISSLPSPVEVGLLPSPFFPFPFHTFSPLLSPIHPLPNPFAFAPLLRCGLP